MNGREFNSLRALYRKGVISRTLFVRAIVEADVPPMKKVDYILEMHKDIHIMSTKPFPVGR